MCFAASSVPKTPPNCEQKIPCMGTTPKGAGLDGEEEGGAREGDGEDDEEQVAGKGGAEKPVGCSKCRWKGCGVCREPKRAKQKDDRKRARPPDG